jgi:hypothetical protein
MAVGIHHVDMRHPLSANVGTNFIDKQWLLGWYSLLADSGHGAFSLDGRKSDHSKDGESTTAWCSDQISRKSKGIAGLL